MKLTICVLNCKLSSKAHSASLLCPYSPFWVMSIIDDNHFIETGTSSGRSEEPTDIKKNPKQTLSGYIKTAMSQFGFFGTTIAGLCLILFFIYHVLDLHKVYLVHWAQHQEEANYFDEVCQDSLIMHKLKDKHHCASTKTFLMTNPWEKALSDKLWSLSLCGDHRCERIVSLIDDHKFLFIILFFLFILFTMWIIVHRTQCVYVNSNFLPLDKPDEFLNVGPGSYKDPDYHGVLSPSINAALPSLRYRRNAGKFI